MGIKITERPIHYDPRSTAEGKKARAWDFLRYLVAMIRFRFRPKANKGIDSPGAGLGKRLAVPPQAKHSA